MKEAIIHPGPRVEIKESPIPTPNASQVVIKVVSSGTNPKDWKYSEWSNESFNHGDDIAGTVHAVGSAITEFKVGDRVAAFHELHTPGGSFADYALAWGHTTFHIPKETSFEKASTLPLAFMTAALGLYHYLRVPQPFVPLLNSEKSMPLLIYSGASAVGAYAIKLACLSNIHPIIAVAGNGIPFVQTLLDPGKGDVVVDYRLGSEAIVNSVKEAVKKVCGDNGKIEYALDAATYKGSWNTVSAALDGKGAATFVLPDYRDKDLPGTLKTSMTFVGVVHKNEEGEVMGTKEFGYVWFRLLSRGLQEGWMTSHPYEIVPGGLNGLEKALVQLKAGKTSAKKLIISVGED